MRSSIKLHNDLLRKLLADLSGYEVKTEGDAFMVVFDSPLKSLEWSIKVQLALLELDWPSQLLDNAESKEEKYLHYPENGSKPIEIVLWRGLRVRIGIHIGEPIHSIDALTGRSDYFGPVVNKAARVASTPCGGQIMVSGETWSMLQTPENEEGLRDLQRRIPFGIKELGEFRLKGLDSDTLLIQITPKQLEARVFTELPSNKPTKKEEQVLKANENITTLKKTNKELTERLASLAKAMEELTNNCNYLKNQLSGPNPEVEKMIFQLGEMLQIQQTLAEELKSISLHETEVSEKLREDLNQTQSDMQKEKDNLIIVNQKLASTLEKAEEESRNLISCLDKAKEKNRIIDCNLANINQENQNLKNSLIDSLQQNEHLELKVQDLIRGNENLQRLFEEKTFELKNQMRQCELKTDEIDRQKQKIKVQELTLIKMEDLVKRLEMKEKTTAEVNDREREALIHKLELSKKQLEFEMFNQKLESMRESCEKLEQKDAEILMLKETHRLDLKRKDEDLKVIRENAAKLLKSKEEKIKHLESSASTKVASFMKNIFD